jgi:hypothetical protein
VKNFRLISSTVFCASILALSACGGGDTTTASSDATASAPAATSAATSAPAPAATSAAPAAASDKEICDAAVKAGAALKEKMVAAMMGQQEMSDADLVALYTSSVGSLEPLAAGGASAVAKAAQGVTDQAKKAAASADPMAAVSTPEWEKAATELDTACKAVGVDVNFA